MKLSLTINIDDDLKNLAQQFPKAGQAVLNRTAVYAKTVVSRELPKEYNLRKTDIGSRIKIIRSTNQSLSATLRFSQRRFNPMMFASPNQPTTKRQAVFLEIKRGNKEAVGAKWFIQRGKKSGKLNIFTQEGGNREQLTLMKWLTADNIFDMGMINPLIERLARQKIEKDLQRVIEAFYKAGK
jgi:hypothetical protein